MSISKATNIKVLVRVRPLLPREETLEDESSKKCLITMPVESPMTTILKVPATSTFHSQKNKQNRPGSPSSSEEEFKKYTFDESIWSFDTQHDNFVDNSAFYEKTGPDIINHFFQGYNVCLLAYGQTSSGKTHTMMGNRSDPGLIPLIIKDILGQKELLINEKINCEVKISYIEIYNEQVNDLLGSDDSTKCRVREHPVTGPYVENLKDFLVNDYDDFKNLLNKGNLKRSTATTSMNDKSSRSHAIITLTLKQTKFADADSSLDIGDADEEMVSNIKLVDLAGSERLAKTKVYGQQDRIKEGTLINKSLSVLGRCINLLSANSSNTSSKPALVPYRDSILTYLLKENLAGNSRSFMIFCVSPLDFEETYQTLNYATQVKTIKTAARANKTKLSTIPVQWDLLHQSDQDAITTLKQEVQDLTDKLRRMENPEQIPSSAGDNFDKLINYWENETRRLKFENKYLKNQLNKKDKEVHELNRHVNYIDHEFDEFAFQIQRIQSDNVQQEKNHLQMNCRATVEELERELEIFDPVRAF